MPVVGVGPGAAYGTAKRWLPERFAEAAIETARAQGGSVAFFGSEGERELCQTVTQMVGQAGVAGHNLAGATTLSEFIELVAACRVFLTNDSGAMHIASALGVPTVAVFGATDDSTKAANVAVLCACSSRRQRSGVRVPLACARIRAFSGLRVFGACSMRRQTRRPPGPLSVYLVSS